MTGSTKEYYQEYRRKNAERIRAYFKAKCATPDYRKRKKAFKQLRGPKERASHMISTKIRRGTVQRGNCVFCGTPNAHAHHEDYDKPYEIVWVCQQHHSDIHYSGLKVDSSMITVIPKRARRVAITPLEGKP